MIAPPNITARIAMSFIPGIKAKNIRALASIGVFPEDLFIGDALEKSVELASVIDKTAFKSNLSLAWQRAIQEYDFIVKNNIKVYSLFDEDYPWLLREIPDAPVALYKLGDMDLNGEHILALVGTRKCTAYGAAFCREAVSSIAGYIPDLKIISGLAFGIDTAAHESALYSDVRTAAVIAHGLDMIYPAANRMLAKNIIKSGGAIVSEYPSGSKPYAGNFLERNRIVAGLSHITVVAESEIKGGAMSTANFAFNYNRDVGALPGRVSDKSSGGCNHLIRKNKANLITSGLDIMELMNWQPSLVKVDYNQRNLFPELAGNNKAIFEYIKNNNSAPVTIDAIHVGTGISVPQLMASLTELEFDGIINRLPGNRFQIS